jgi:hypothetical protein
MILGDEGLVARVHQERAEYVPHSELGPKLGIHQGVSGRQDYSAIQIVQFGVRFFERLIHRLTEISNIRTAADSLGGSSNTVLIELAVKR